MGIQTENIGQISAIKVGSSPPSVSTMMWYDSDSSGLTVAQRFKTYGGSGTITDPSKWNSLPFESLSAIEIRDLLETLSNDDRLSADYVKDGTLNLFMTVAERELLLRYTPFGFTNKSYASILEFDASNKVFKRFKTLNVSGNISVNEIKNCEDGCSIEWIIESSTSFNVTFPENFYILDNNDSKTIEFSESGLYKIIMTKFEDEYDSSFSFSGSISDSSFINDRFTVEFSNKYA